MNKDLNNGQPQSVGKAVKKYCFEECSISQRKELELCPLNNCPLYNFRDGKNPFRKKRELSEERKAELAENLRRGREKRLNKKGEK